MGLGLGVGGAQVGGLGSRVGGRAIHGTGHRSGQVLGEMKASGIR